MVLALIFSTCASAPLGALLGNNKSCTGMVVYVSSVFSVFIASDMNVSVSWCGISRVCGQCGTRRQREADSICACMNNFSHSDDSKCQHNILLGKERLGKGKTVLCAC